MENTLLERPATALSEATMFATMRFPGSIRDT
jgi:hypothetical protein